MWREGSYQQREFLYMDESRMKSLLWCDYYFYSSTFILFKCLWGLRHWLFPLHLK